VPEGHDVTDAEQRAIDAGDEEELALHVARRYYLDDQSKVDVAKALGLSRFQVARLIADARRRGQVRIEIGAPGRLDEGLGRGLAESLGIGRAVVVQGSGSTESVKHVAEALGQVLGEVVREGDTLGICWSRPVEALARTLEALQPCTVVQLAGALHLTGDRLGSVEVVRALAAVSGGTAHPVYAPLVVDSAETAQALRRQPSIAGSLDLAAGADVAVFGVGSWRPSGSAVYDTVADEVRQEAVAAGAVGEVSGRLLAADGSPVRTALDDRVVGVSLDGLHAVPTRIVTAHGAHRAEATVAVVRAGLVGTLVVDDALARALLAR
jgi:DNA-binding transcriptional regulator LsrR (DeoR family)